jgi:hypothetical protein
MTVTGQAIQRIANPGCPCESASGIPCTVQAQ